MLSGHYPWDDDRANPDCNNINLLYKYIASSPLIFPDCITPMSRDLLERILVPDPQKRADLQEVGLHNWLLDYRNVTGFFPEIGAAIGTAISSPSKSTEP